MTFDDFTFHPGTGDSTWVGHRCGGMEEPADTLADALDIASGHVCETDEQFGQRLRRVLASAS